MKLPDFFKRVFVKLTGFQPPVFEGEEKEKLRQKMIDDNRRQQKDISKSSYITGLEYEEIQLPNCSGWLIRTNENPEDKIIYYIHGGGFTGACTKDRMEFLSCLVKEFHYNVFSIDYRLAPEFMYPSQLNDCVDGYRWLINRYSSDNIVFIGESAGANLVTVLGMYLKDNEYELPSAIYANSVVSQFDGYTESYERCSLKTDFIVVKGIIENMTNIYCKEEQQKDPYVAPLYSETRGLPPLWLTVSTSECLYDDSRMLYQKMKELGNEVVLKDYDSLCHAFIISPHMKNVRKKSYGDLKDFLTEYLG